MASCDIFRTKKKHTHTHTKYNTLQFSAGPSLIHFQMNVEPLLPSNPIFRFLFLLIFCSLIITSGSIHGLALRFLFLLYRLIILIFGPFRW